MADIKVVELQKIAPKLSDYIFMVGENSEFQGKVEELAPLLLKQHTQQIAGQSQSVIATLNALDTKTAQSQQTVGVLRDDFNEFTAEFSLSESTKAMWRTLMGG